MPLEFVTAQFKDGSITPAKLDLTNTQTYNFGGADTTLQYKTPATSAEVATKGYVDGLVNGLYWKDPVVAASTGNLNGTYVNGASGVGATLTNAGDQAAFSLDGESLAEGDRVLIKDQSDAKQNGIYVITAIGSGSANWVLTRAEDLDASIEFPSAAVFVVAGTQNDNQGYTCTNDDPPTIGTTNINFVQFTGVGALQAGAGISKVGDKISVDVESNRGLEFIGSGDAAKIGVSLASNKGLAFDGAAIQVDYDDTTIGIISNKLAVKDGSIGLAKVGFSAVSDEFSSTGTTLFTLTQNVATAAFANGANVQIFRNGQRMRVAANMGDGLDTGAAFIYQEGGATKFAIKTATAAGEIIQADYLK